MRHKTRLPSSWGVRLLLAAVASSIACAAANGAVTVIGTQYQQDNPYTEFQCVYHYGNYPTSCGSTITGCNVSVFLKNTDASSRTISNVTLAGYSLSTILKRRTDLHDSNSIYYYWQDPPQDIFDKGEPVWYKADPNPIPAGGTARVVVRLRSVPVTQPVSLGVVTSVGTVTATVPVNASDPVLASVGFSTDRKKVYLTWRRSGGAAPTTIKMDDVDVTSYATTVGDTNVNYAVTVLSFDTAIANMSYHVYQGVFSDGKTATGGVRTWYNRFLYGTWGVHEMADNDTTAVKAWIKSCNYRAVNCYVNNSCGALQTFMATSAGRDYAEYYDYGYVKDSNVWGTNPRMWFIDDEPDLEEGNLTCGTGLVIPCGGGHVTGILGRHVVEIGETLRAINPSVPTTINLDGNFKPDGWYAYGQLADVMMVDTYYEEVMANNHWFYPQRDPLYAQPTSVYACAVATARAAEPNPAHVILYSNEYKNLEYGYVWPFADPNSKRIQSYYALAGGAKGMAYWWYKSGYPFNGLDDGGPEAQALWKGIGLVGAEIKTLAPQLVTSHPVDVALTPSTDVWAKAAACGTDTLILYAVNDNHYNDGYGIFHYTSVPNANVVVGLPSWMTSSPSAFEVRASGLYDITTSQNGSNLTVQLGTLGVTKLVVITTDPNLRGLVQARYVSSVWPGVCAFASDYCVPQNSPPAITSQPVNTMAAIGEPAAFSVTATGSTPMYYQWKKNGVNISGATSSAYQIASVVAGDAGSYSCYIWNAYGNVTSSSATLTLAASNRCLQNPGAEEGFTLTDGSNIANNWTEWESATGVCTGYDETVTVHGGSHAQRIRVWGASGSSAGCYQRMPATSGVPYTVTAYVYAFDSLSSCYLGVDPSGGTNPASGVTWSSVTTSQSWVQKSVTVTAASSYITVYYKVVSGDVNKHNGYFDDATPACQPVTPPSITQQPTNQIVGLGGTASFSVTAEGTEPLTYQWKKNGTNISGATSSTLQLSNCQLTDEGSYTCYVANDYGNVTSNAATLTVSTSGVIVNANFEASTVGNPPYGWTTYIQSTKSGNWTIQTVGAQEGTLWQQTQVYNPSSYGGIRQSVTGLAAGTVYTVSGYYRSNSGTATASVRYNLAGNTDRANSTLLVSTSGTDWTAFSGTVTATGSSLMLFLDHLNGTSSNKAGAFDNLKVACTPIITQQPVASSICAGSNTTFVVAATGAGTLTYQWQKNSVNISNGGHYSGCTTATLAITGADTNDAANYRCKVSNAAGSTTSNQAALTIKTATAITGQPSAQTACVGTSVLFSVTATGEGALSYQWQKNSVNLTNTGHYSDVTTATLVISPADTSDAANYRCVVTAGCGSATSSAVGLTIKAATVVTSNPTDSTICAGSNASFAVAATGEGTLTYQWLKNGMYITNGGHYSGATTATLAITGADTNDEAFYSCLVSGECDNATSDEAVLLVNGNASLTNGNFEYSTVGNPPYGWTTYIQSTKSGAWSIQTATPPEGANWQQTQVYNISSYGGIRQNVTGLSSGGIYTISGTYRTNSGTATASVRYSLSANTDRAYSTVLVSKTDTNWGTFSTNVTATGGTLTLFLDHLNGASSNKASAFDNIKVICAP